MPAAATSSSSPARTAPADASATARTPRPRQRAAGREHEPVLLPKVNRDSLGVEQLADRLDGGRERVRERELRIGLCGRRQKRARPVELRLERTRSFAQPEGVDRADAERPEARQAGVVGQRVGAEGDLEDMRRAPAEPEAHDTVSVDRRAAFRVGRVCCGIARRPAFLGADCGYQHGPVFAQPPQPRCPRVRCFDREANDLAGRARRVGSRGEGLARQLQRIRRSLGAEGRISVERPERGGDLIGRYAGEQPLARGIRGAFA